MATRHVDLSSLTRDQNVSPCTGSQIPNHWTAREVSESIKASAAGGGGFSLYLVASDVSKELMQSITRGPGWIQSPWWEKGSMNRGVCKIWNHRHIHKLTGTNLFGEKRKYNSVFQCHGLSQGESWNSGWMLSSPGTPGWLRSSARLVVFQGHFPDVNSGNLT